MCRVEARNKFAHVERKSYRSILLLCSSLSFLQTIKLIHWPELQKGAIIKLQ
jgi:hypothetical protein